jgi:pimeloyl-ACP methyl ester carboxylesterase
VNVYFISGLGADRSVFKHIRLPQGHEAIYIDWIPLLRNETLASYALRLSETIDTTQPFSLVGLSFGGMIAVEIAKQKTPVHTILISSIPSVRHLPYYFRIAGRLRLHRIVPVSLIRQAAVIKRFFTTETADDKRMLRTMIRKSDAQFIKWAMHAVLAWDNNDMPERLIHIHGTHDEILPNRFTKPTHVIERGGHLMVMNHATEINKILETVLLKDGKAQHEAEYGPLKKFEA